MVKIGVQGAIGVEKDKLKGIFKRENTPIRQGIAEARKLLYAQDELDNAKVQIKSALQDAAKKRFKSLKKEAQLGRREAEDALQKIRAELSNLITDEIQYISFVLHRLSEVAQKQKIVISQVPSMAQHEEVLEKEIGTMLQLAYKLQNPVSQIRQKSHREHFFLRELLSGQRKLLKDQRHLDKHLDKFQSAIDKHILKQLQDSSTKIESTGKKMIKHLRLILEDTICFIYVILDEIKGMISEEEKLEKNIPDIKKDEEWTKNMLGQILGEARDYINKAKSINIAA